MKKRAFTLIELLVVISIIALLLSILMPALAKVREQGKRIVCSSHIKQNLLALQMYAMENKEAAIPYVKETNSQGTLMPLPWDIALRGYFGEVKKNSSKKYVACPADRKERVKPTDPAFEDYLSGEALARSYQINGALDNGASAEDDEGLINGTPLYWSNRSGIVAKVSQVSRACEVLWMVECFIGAKDDNYRDLRDARVPMSALREGCIQGSNYWGSTWWPPSVAGFPAFYNHSSVAEIGDQHKAGGNWGYIDGHVEWFNHDSSARDLYHAFGGPVYPFSWCDTKTKRSKAKIMGFIP